MKKAVVNIKHLSFTRASKQADNRVRLNATQPMSSYDN